MRYCGGRAAGKASRAALVMTVAFIAAVTIAGTAAAETAIERGRYLVTTIGACGNCHTPRAADGQPARNMELAGGFAFDEQMIGHIVGPNITPDRETGIGGWTEAQIVTALREGKRPDGTIIGPPMPIPVYRNLSDGDARVIAAYLKSLKPVRHAVARSQFMIPLPAAYGPPVAQVAEPDRADKVAYGAYLAGPVGHCVLCHTPPGAGKPFDMSRAWQGGRELPDFETPGGLTVSRNITADPDDGIGKWSDAEIKKAIVSGIRPDGTRLSRTMPFEAYAKMTPADLDAVVAFLRSLNPQAAR
jgi:mono/diheme cytochrome c family protein